MYEYSAKLVKVVDGDTIDLQVDLGFRVLLEDRFRLRGVDTPERNSKDPEERRKAIEATNTVRDLLEDRQLKIRTYKYKQGKYGRWLVDVFFLDNDSWRCLNTYLLEEGIAEEYR